VLGPLIGCAVAYQLAAWSLEKIRLVKLPRLRMSPRAVDLSVKLVVAGLLLYGVLRNLN
jgi:hypothetical protein